MSTSSIRRWCSGLAALAVLLVGGTAHAAEPVRYTAEGKLRLHVDTSLFGWTQVRPWYRPEDRPDINTHDRTNIIGFGAARPLMIDGAGGTSGLYGLDGSIFSGGSMFALGLGYGVHRHVLIGARLGLSFDRVRGRSDDEEPDVLDVYRFFSATFTPYIEILPIAEGRVLPFILFRGGVSGAAFGHRTTASLGPLGEVDTLGRTSAISPLVGVGAGAHFFLIPQFSFDLGVNFDYRWGLTRQYDRDTEGVVTKSDWDRSFQAFNLGLNLGLSVWFL